MDINLDELSDDALAELIDAAKSSADLSELIQEAAKRNNFFDDDELDDLLCVYVQKALFDAKDNFRRAHQARWKDDQALEQEFSDCINRWAQETGIDLRPGDGEDALDWPWPIDIPKEGSGGSDFADIQNQYSGLRICGYRVGKTNGLSKRERIDLLSQFFLKRLPPEVAQFHGDAYGEPGSEKRLKQMANVIASHCRNFTRNNPERYKKAIADWRMDLEFLKENYYHAGSFPWPSDG